MNIVKPLKQFATVLGKNSPALLTATAVVGVVGSIYLTASAAAKAARHIDYVRESENRPVELKEQVQLTWKLFLPPLTLGVATIGCIIGAQSINMRRQALLLSAYSLSEKTLTDYKGAVNEVVGEKKAQEIQEHAGYSRMQEVGPSSLIVGSGKVLCFETFTGRYFECDMESIRKAANDVKLIARNELGAAANEFWLRIGLGRLPLGEEIGWNPDKPLDLVCTAQLHEGKPAIVVDYITPPFYNYDSPF